MNASNLEWAKAKAEQLLRDQVNLIAKSEYPASDFAEGMLEAFYAVGLIGDLRREHWDAGMRLAVVHGRDELREAKCKALFDVQVVAGGELINEGGL